jgi:hypothetical protein
MERGMSHHEDTPSCYDDLDHFALQALVDRLFTESDARVFQILNKYFLEEKENE